LELDIRCASSGTGTAAVSIGLDLFDASGTRLTSMPPPLIVKPGCPSGEPPSVGSFTAGTVENSAFEFSLLAGTATGISRISLLPTIVATGSAQASITIDQISLVQRM